MDRNLVPASGSAGLVPPFLADPPGQHSKRQSLHDDGEENHHLRRYDALSQYSVGTCWKATPLRRPLSVACPSPGVCRLSRRGDDGAVVVADLISEGIPH
jgi:hypothetical protein